MDALEFKEYIFGMLFLKRLSDQFDHDREKLRQKYTKDKLREDLIKKQLENTDKYEFFVPEKAHWSKIKHLKQSVGSGLNKALAAIEDANPDTLQDVLKAINFNRKVGQRTMDDSILIEFIQHFDCVPLGGLTESTAEAPHHPRTGGVCRLQGRNTGTIVIYVNFLSRFFWDRSPKCFFGLTFVNNWPTVVRIEQRVLPPLQGGVE